MAHERTFHVVVAAVGETKFDGQAASMTVPASAGEMTVLAHHEPFVTTLKTGVITVRDAQGEHSVFEISDGVLEVNGGGAVVLL